MTIATYADLKTSMANWLFGRTDLTSVIPDFITMAEADFNRKLRVRQMIVRAQATANGTQYIELPSNFIEMLNLQCSVSGGSTPLMFKTLDDIDKYRYNNAVAGISAVPQYFTINGDQIELVPVPEDGSTLEMTYYGTITALSDSNQTNWLLTKAPDLYLFASLMNASPYLEDDERVPLWGARKQEIIDEMNAEAWRANISGGTLVRGRSTFG